jgi:hypothetical protein
LYDRKKYTLAACLFFAVLHGVSAGDGFQFFEHFEIVWNVGSYNGVMVFPLTEDYHLTEDYYYEMQLSALDVSLEHKKTNIGVTWSLLKYRQTFLTDVMSNELAVFFINPALYWYFLDLKNIKLGAFVSVNYLNLDIDSSFNEQAIIFGIDKPLLCSGIRFIWNTGYRGFALSPIQRIGTDVGYRYFGGHSLYFTVTLYIVP